MVNGSFQPAALMHPDYVTESEFWQLYRLTFEGGADFLDEYMQKFSAREQDAEFQTRKKISYCPSFAKAAVNEINNAIFQRMADVTRLGGSESYRNAVIGHKGGVDLCGNSMTSFMGQEVLPELLSMRKVGIFVDMPKVPAGATLADINGKRPYVYIYEIENIYNWTTDQETGEFTRLLLRELVYASDPATGLPTLTHSYIYKFFSLTAEGVRVVTFDDKGLQKDDKTIVGMKKIPFILLEIRESLLKDVASYQVSLLNMASSDVNYSFRANFPLYTEQADFRMDSPHLVPSQGGSRTPGNAAGTSGTVAAITGGAVGEAAPGTASAGTTAKNNELSLGTGRGRRYPKGVERPGFIHPSAEPLLASIEKQERMKSEIRMLVHLSVSNLSQKMASAESKSYDERGLESGLSAVGLILERAERQIAEFWAIYENKTEPAVVTYPSSYSLETDSDRIEKAAKLAKLVSSVASKSYQKEVCKKVARTLLGSSLPLDKLDAIEKEIDTTDAVVCDPEVLIQSMEQGALSAETFGKLMGFPSGESEKAKMEHAERLARIAEAQSEANEKSGNELPGGEADVDPANSSKDQKKGKPTRGNGKSVNRGGES